MNQWISFGEQLRERIHMEDVRIIARSVEGSDGLKQELYNLTFNDDRFVAYQALWVMTHFSVSENRWLFQKQNQLIDQALKTSDTGMLRLILSILIKQPFDESPRVDFLDFCFENIGKRDVPPAIRVVCMKLGFELSRFFPELLDELSAIIALLDHVLPPSLASARRNVSKAIEKKKSSYFKTELQ